MPRASKDGRAEYMRQYRIRMREKPIEIKLTQDYIKEVGSVITDILAGKKAAEIKQDHSLDTSELREIMKIIKAIKDA